MYHIMNRGDQREDSFKDDADRQRFLVTLGDCCQKTEWQVHACCLKGVALYYHLYQDNLDNKINAMSPDKYKRCQIP